MEEKIIKALELFDFYKGIETVDLESLKKKATEMIDKTTNYKDFLDVLYGGENGSPFDLMIRKELNFHEDIIRTNVNSMKGFLKEMRLNIPLIMKEYGIEYIEFQEVLVNGYPHYGYFRFGTGRKFLDTHIEWSSLHARAIEIISNKLEVDYYEVFLTLKDNHMISFDPDSEILEGSVGLHPSRGAHLNNIYNIKNYFDFYQLEPEIPSKGGKISFGEALGNGIWGYGTLKHHVLGVEILLNLDYPYTESGDLIKIAPRHIISKGEFDHYNPLLNISESLDYLEPDSEVRNIPRISSLKRFYLK